MTKDAHKIFEQMMTDMRASNSGDDMLEACMNLNKEALSFIPMRYRIIALGFVKRFTLEELNEKLTGQGCPKLYSRNFWEATLIYAFLNRLTYEEWKNVQAQCDSLYDAAGDAPYFGGKKITYGELERYVQENSDAGGSVLATEMLTQHLEAELSEIGNDVDALKRFFTANLRSFSAVREKTRYYFCKYLYYYLNRKIERYFAACKKGRGVDAALSELLALKAVTTLRRNKKMPEEEKRAVIRDSAVSCGELFDEFNFFYFEYVSIDWVEILMEYYGDAEEIPDAQKKSLAAVFRKGRPELKRMSDDKVIRLKIEELEEKEDELQAVYARDGKTKGYGKNRSGEHTVYKYIQGTLDIDRTTLICFLLFFASDADMPEAHRLKKQRVDEILLQCGYGGLREENDFDWFVEEFLRSRRPKDFLMEEIVSYAKQHENSFLYHIYGNAVRYEEEICRIMARPRTE